MVQFYPPLIPCPSSSRRNVFHLYFLPRKTNKQIFSFVYPVWRSENFEHWEINTAHISKTTQIISVCSLIFFFSTALVSGKHVTGTRILNSNFLVFFSDKSLGQHTLKRITSYQVTKHLSLLPSFISALHEFLHLCQENTFWIL